MKQCKVEDWKTNICLPASVVGFTWLFSPVLSYPSSALLPSSFLNLERGKMGRTTPIYEAN